MRPYIKFCMHSQYDDDDIITMSTYVAIIEINIHAVG